MLPVSLDQFKFSIFFGKFDLNFRNGRFDKILDMMKFRDAILDSEMRRLSSTEHQLLASAAIENEKSLEVLSRYFFITNLLFNNLVLREIRSKF